MAASKRQLKIPSYVFQPFHGSSTVTALIEHLDFFQLSGETTNDPKCNQCFYIPDRSRCGSVCPALQVLAQSNARPKVTFSSRLVVSCFHSASFHFFFTLFLAAHIFPNNVWRKAQSSVLPWTYNVCSASCWSSTWPGRRSRITFSPPEFIKRGEIPSWLEPYPPGTWHFAPGAFNSQLARIPQTKDLSLVRFSTRY